MEDNKTNETDDRKTGGKDVKMLDGLLGIVQEWLEGRGLVYRMCGDDIATAGTIDGAGPCTHVMLTFFVVPRQDSGVGVMAFPAHRRGDGAIGSLPRIMADPSRLLGSMRDIEVAPGEFVRFAPGRTLREYAVIGGSLPPVMGGGSVMLIAGSDDTDPGLSLALTIPSPSPAMLDLALSMSTSVVKSAYAELEAAK